MRHTKIADDMQHTTSLSSKKQLLVQPQLHTNILYKRCTLNQLDCLFACRNNYTLNSKKLMPLHSHCWRLRLDS